MEVIGTGFHFPQDFAFDPPDGLWVLTQAGRGRPGAGTLTRVALAGPLPVEASQLPGIALPFSPDPAHFRMGSVVRDLKTGDLYVAERLGRHIFRASPGAEPVLYARGLNLLADSRTLAFDADGHLVVLDFVGRSAVVELTPGPPREWFGDEDRYQGPVIYRLRVDEPLPLPRNLEYATPIFPPPALRRAGTRLSRYVGVLALPSGDLILSGLAGEIHRLRPDGTIVPVATVPVARVVVAGSQGELYTVDFLGGRIDRVLPDGTVQPFVQGLSRPAAVTVLPDGTVLVAEDTSRLLRLRPDRTR